LALSRNAPSKRLKCTTSALGRLRRNGHEEIKIYNAETRTR
jgi:hypothetical protein